MSTLRVVLPYPHHVGAVSVFLDVAGRSTEPRQHVVCCRAFLGSVELTLDAPKWPYSDRLEAPFCYLPTEDGEPLVELPPVFVGHEVTNLRFDLMPWSRQAQPLTVRSGWAKVAEPFGESTIFALSLQEEDTHA